MTVTEALADARAYATQHPEVEAARKAAAAAVVALERVSAKALERAVLVLLGEIPLIGGVVETIAQPLLDAAEAKLEDEAVKATTAALDDGA